MASSGGPWQQRCAAESPSGFLPIQILSHQPRLAILSGQALASSHYPHVPTGKPNKARGCDDPRITRAPPCVPCRRRRRNINAYGDPSPSLTCGPPRPSHPFQPLRRAAPACQDWAAITTPVPKQRACANAASASRGARCPSPCLGIAFAARITPRDVSPASRPARHGSRSPRPEQAVRHARRFARHRALLRCRADRSLGRVVSHRLWMVLVRRRRSPTVFNPVITHSPCASRHGKPETRICDIRRPVRPTQQTVSLSSAIRGFDGGLATGGGASAIQPPSTTAPAGMGRRQAVNSGRWALAVPHGPLTSITLQPRQRP